MADVRSCPWSGASTVGDMADRRGRQAEAHRSADPRPGARRDGARCSTSWSRGSTTGDFNTGAALVTKIAEAADEMNHHPDVDLRYPHLTVSLMSHDVDAITPRDIRLAHEISELAAEAGVSPAEHAPDVLEFALDTPDYERGQAVLGGDPRVRRARAARETCATRPSARPACGSRTPTPRPRTGSAGTSTSASRRGGRGADPGRDRRRRPPGQRRACPGLLGARRPRRQPGLHLHLGEPRTDARRARRRRCRWDGCPIFGTAGRLS